MPIRSDIDEHGIATVIMDNPPVNALTVAGWFELADVVRSLGEDPAVRVVILAAEGRGYNAGVDIKEMQATEGYEALIGANKGCYAAFAAVYECAVPVIAAVNGFCLGGGLEHGELRENSVAQVAPEDSLRHGRTLYRLRQRSGSRAARTTRRVCPQDRGVLPVVTTLRRGPNRPGATPALLTAAIRAWAGRTCNLGCIAIGESFDVLARLNRDT